MMSKTKFQAIVEFLLLLAMAAILTLVVIGWASGAPSHEDLNDKIDSLQRQVVVLNCQINAPDEIARAACEALEE